MIVDIIVLNVARESPNILKDTSLQLIISFSNCFKRSFADAALLSPKSQTKDSLKNPCSIPKC